MAARDSHGIRLKVAACHHLHQAICNSTKPVLPASPLGTGHHGNMVVLSPGNRAPQASLWAACTWTLGDLRIHGINLNEIAHNVINGWLGEVVTEHLERRRKQVPVRLPPCHTRLLPLSVESHCMVGQGDGMRTSLLEMMMALCNASSVPACQGQSQRREHSR